MRKIYCIVLLLMATVAIYAQAPDCPKDTVNGEEVYKYQVEKSIGLYRIGVNFNVPQSEIIRMNPQLKERGLHYGETILIPTGRKVEKKRETKPEVLKEIEHAKMVESAKVADPVKITEPVKTPEPKVEPVDTVAITEAVPAPMDTVVEPAPAAEAESVSRKVIELALMLPFESRQTKRSANAEKMVDFYQGALLALHDLQNDSTLYRLRVYDTERSDRRVTTLTLGRDLDSAQAILGLAYPIQVAVLAPWCEEHQVPLITPFMDELDLTGFSQLMLFNAGDQQQADSLCNWVLSQPDIHCVNVEANDIVSTPTIRTLRKTMRLKGIDIFALSLSDLMADSATYALDKQKENLIISGRT